jgi:hypothetical protein
MGRSVSAADPPLTGGRKATTSRSVSGSSQPTYAPFRAARTYGRCGSRAAKREASADQASSTVAGSSSASSHRSVDSSRSEANVRAVTCIGQTGTPVR